ncbi:Na+/H+ antiporter subunit E [Haloarchaeobius litoreus]|uniref:Na+/H+ antiporter subunit E n=1 Tax=Haloarchaeobius litoreus TaxID=755306 RepID=A0ABD6DPP9_9EURY|nr:Na+/H+ antiporter subunit E [Haloarchaeobius litoreus]
MPQVPEHEPRVLAVVTAPATADRTVEHALREGRDARAESDGPVAVEVLVLAPDETTGEATARRVETAVSAFDGLDAPAPQVSTVVPGAGADSTDALLAQLDGRRVTRLVLAADSELAVERLRDRLGVGAVELVGGEPPGGRRSLVHAGGWRRYATVFALSYLFYLAIGGFVGGLDLLTGAFSAAVVALALSSVSFVDAPTRRRTVPRVARTVAFLPVLLWEVAKANVALAVVILHPRLPIDPSVDALETDTREDLERMVLANSITLTPGTLTVDVQDRTFLVHSLTAESRESLESGRLQRLVSWVFHGRGADAEPTDDGGKDP